MINENNLRDLDLENDVIGIVYQCPWTVDDVRPEWFLNQLQSEVVRYVRENQAREGLITHLAEMFGISRRECFERLEAWRKASMIHAPIALLPQYCARLEDLNMRRQKLAAATEMAKEAFAGVTMEV